MSKRFGRNQRRKLRDLVNYLERKLAGGWMRASGRYPAIEVLCGSALSIEVTERRDRYRASKEAEVCVYLNSDSLFRIANEDYRPLVEFDGGVWRLHEITVNEYGYGDSSYLAPRDAYFGEPPRATIRLIAEPSR